MDINKVTAFDNTNNDVTIVTDPKTINVRAKDMAAMVEYWDKTDAIVEGYETIKAAGKTYLPKFAEEDESDYKVRLNLTKFTNVYRDVLEGLATKPFEEEVQVLKDEKNPIPPVISDFAENVDGAGNNLTMFSAQTFFNGINSAIDWIFVDYPTFDPETVRTIADQKAQNIKPFWSHVLGRNVYEARSEIIGSDEILSYIKIFEPGVSGPDRFRIFQRTTAGVVTWELWEKNPQEQNGSEKQFFRIGFGTLSIDIIPMVPFATGRRDGKSFKYFPAMRDAADLQIDLYQDESALKFIKTMAGYPMLAGNGVKPEKGADGKPMKLAVGPMRVLYSSPDASGSHGEWKFIEPSATSMEFLQKSITETKQDLRELGRQPLTALTGQLTVITTAVAAGKARSAVSAWALALKDALENALEITAKYFGLADYEAQINVFTEFDTLTEGGADLTELGKARDRNDISQETYWLELKRRKVLSPEFDAEEEKKRLLDSIPSDNITPTPNKPAGG